MIDTHCHVDLFPDPLKASRKLDNQLSTCVAVTMLPSHFEVGVKHLNAFKRIKAAIGLHPLRAKEAQKEVHRFCSLAPKIEYIGEIGLDGSVEGRSSLELQKKLFAEAICAIAVGSFVTVHSRSAWQETVALLKANRVGPVCFHYFTGGPLGMKEIIDQGHFVSVNSRMIESTNRHQPLLAGLPKDRILAESDAPFLEGDPASQLATVYSYFSKIWQIDLEETKAVMANNLLRCRTSALKQSEYGENKQMPLL